MIGVTQNAIVVIGSFLVRPPATVHVHAQQEQDPNKSLPTTHVTEQSEPVHVYISVHTRVVYFGMVWGLRRSVFLSTKLPENGTVLQAHYEYYTVYNIPQCNTHINIYISIYIYEY